METSTEYILQSKILKQTKRQAFENIENGLCFIVGVRVESQL